jgi:hypothetical protein
MKIEAWDYVENGNHNFIGRIIISMNEIDTRVKGS